jgi:hypothetical protein
MKLLEFCMKISTNKERELYYFEEDHLSWSTPVYINRFAQYHPIIEAKVESHTVEEMPLIVTEKFNLPTFFDIFQGAYQRCLHGPLTVIPRKMQ